MATIHSAAQRSVCVCLCFACALWPLHSLLCLFVVFFFFCKLFSELSYIYFCLSVHSGFFSLAFVCVFDCIEMIRICWRETPIMSPHVHMPLLTLLHRSIFIHQNYFLWLDFVCLSYKMSPLDLLFRWRIIIVIIIILNNLCSCFDLWLTNLDRTGHSQWIYICAYGRIYPGYFVCLCCWKHQQRNSHTTNNYI